jgi:hypothetical protein
MASAPFRRTQTQPRCDSAGAFLLGAPPPPLPPFGIRDRHPLERGEPTLFALCFAAMPDPPPDDPAVHEETDSAAYADDRMFYKVEKWTRDGTKVDSCSTPATASVEPAQYSKRQSASASESNDHPADAGA